MKAPVPAILLSILVFLTGWVTPQSANAAAVRAGFDTSAIAANDDGSTGLVPLGFSADFAGTVYTQVYVNNNGNF